jgi:hypothetical protein
LKHSEAILSGIWTKREELLAGCNSITSVPGGSVKDKRFLSRSGTVPHLVKCINQSYQCGDKCMGFKIIKANQALNGFE